MATSGNNVYTVTTQQIVKDAFVEAGIYRQNQALPTEDYNAGLRKLNTLAKSWQAMGYNIWNDKRATLFLQYGTAKYTLGSTGGWHATESFVETALTNDETTGSTVIEVDDTTGIFAGDNIGIQLDDGTLEWTTVTALGQLTTYLQDFNSAADFTYDINELEVSGGTGHLLLQDNTGQTFNQPFTIDTGFTYDSDETEFSSGQIQQKDQAPTDSTCWATYTTDIDLNVSPNGGVLTGGAVGGAAVSGGKLDLIYGDTRYVDYDADVNADSQQTGTIKFKVTPNYSGSPANDMYFFAITKQASSRFNELSLYHKTTGTINLRIYDSAGLLAGESTFVSWSPTSGVEYEFEVTYDLTAGANRFFIDGVQQGATSVITTTRDANIGLMRIGSSYNASVASNFAINDLVIFSTVQHTASYTPGYTLAETRYVEDLVSLPIFTYAGVGSIQQYTVYATTQTSNGRFNINGQYWTGAAWAASDDSYAQMNTAADINTNIASLIASNTVAIKMIMEASNTQSKVDDLTITYTGQIYSTTTATFSFDNEITGDLVSYNTFAATVSETGSDTVTFVLSDDSGVTNKYWNGVAWVTSDGSVAQSNTAATINTNISTFPITVAGLKIASLFKSATGTTTPTITDVTIVYSDDVIPTIRIGVCCGLSSAASAGNVVYAYTTKINKPLEVKEVMLHQSDNNEVELPRIEREKYFGLSDKSAIGSPNQYYYQRNRLDGYMYLWSTPSDVTQYINFTYQPYLDNFEAAGNEPDFPIEWERAIVLNLASELSCAYGVGMETYNKVVASAKYWLDIAKGNDNESGKLTFDMSDVW